MQDFLIGDIAHLFGRFGQRLQKLLFPASASAAPRQNPVQVSLCQFR